MAATKATSTLFSNQVLTGGTGTTTSSAATISTSFGASMFLKITNGATAPATGAAMTIEVSPDGSNYYKFTGSADLQGSTVNSAVVSKQVELPIGVGYVRVQADHGNSQNVTIRAEVTHITAIT
jgi:hypothetical protein